MKKKHQLVDGFIPRKSSDRLGELHREDKQDAALSRQRQLHTKGDKVARTLGKHDEERTLVGDHTLRELSNLPAESIEKRADARVKKYRKKRHKKSWVRRFISWSFIILVVGVLSVGGFLAYRFISAGGNIFSGNFFDLIRNEPLKEDENGRTNVLIFGTSPDDHDGADLTDSMIVLSINQTTKDVFMVGVPRDVWVRYESPCHVGYQGKINSVYICGAGTTKDSQAGTAALMRKMKDVLGLDIQYSVHVNWDVVRQAVDAVGGIEVEIESTDPRGIYDVGTKVRLSNGTNFIDGETALGLARSRGNFGGYGLSRSDFDRTLNQQRIIKGLQKKALSSGTLTNIGKVTALVDALGDNLETNIEMREVRTFMDISSKINMDTIESIDLAASQDMLLKTDMYGEISIVRPVAGLYDFNAIHAAIKKRATQNPVTRENAKIVVLNGSDTVGLAKREADNLEDKGFTILSIGNAEEGKYKSVEIYRLQDAKPATESALEELFGTAVITDRPSFSVVGDAEYVIVLGAARQ